MSSRTFPPRDNMYGGGRSSRGLLNPREVRATASHPVNSMPRRQLNVLGASVDERVSRGKAIVDEDKLGRDGRISGFVPKPSSGIDQAEGSAYGNTERRSSFRDDLGAMKTIRSDNTSRGEVHRFREVGVGGSLERTYRSEYGDEPRWLRSGGKYGNLQNYDGSGGLRGSGSDLVSFATRSSHEILPGFIFESPKRVILDWSLKGSFGLTFDDRRLAEQLGPGTKVFLFDGNSRELYGVFQCMGYAILDHDSESSSSEVRVRAVKDCLPLLEREFKEIIRANYYASTKFTARLSKEQVGKLIQCFRPVDAGRSMHLSLTSRSSLHSGLVHARQDFHDVSDEFTYGKERRRAPTVETRPFSSHLYHGQAGERLSPKAPAQGHSSKGFSAEADDYEEVIGNLPLDSSSMEILSRGKQQSLRSASGSRISPSHQVNTGRQSNVRREIDGDWRADDARDNVHRKRNTVLSTALDNHERRNRSSSPSWKDSHQSRAEGTETEVYDRAVKGGYKDDLPYVASTRHVRNDIDLNIPLDMAHGEPSSSHMHDVDSKIPRRRVWEEEDDAGLAASPPKGRSLASRGSDYAVASSSREDFEDLSPTSQEDHLLLPMQEKSRPSPVPLLSSFSNGKSVKAHSRPFAVAKPITREKSGLASLLRRESVPAREVFHSSRDYSSRTSNIPVFKIKANLQAAGGKGRAERVVTLLHSSKPRPRFVAAEDDNHLQSWKEQSYDSSEEGGRRSDGRKRKGSVWSRITLPPAKSPVKKAILPHGKGRVFSRLGPTVNTFEARENSVPYKKKKMYPHQNLVWTRKVDVGLEATQVNTELNVVGEDVYVDDSTFSIVPENMEQPSGEPQGWSRKKSQVVSGSSGDEGGNFDAREPGKGGRRKIVRPSIGGRGEGNEMGDKSTPEGDQDSHLHQYFSTASGDQNTVVQQSSQAVMMEIEMTIGEQKVERNAFQNSGSAVATPGGHEPTLISPGAGGRDNEADNMMS